MAIVTVDDSPSKPLRLESIPLIDLRSLSQSELNSLSLCSDNTFDLRRCDDIIIPKIDRSVFNESAGSRKQTYSRLHFAPPEHELNNIGRNRRFSSGLHPVAKHPQNPNLVDDHERRENKQIVTILRELFRKKNPGTDQVPLGSQSEELLVPEALNVENGYVSEDFEEREGKRKRGRPRKYDPIPNRREKLIDQSKAIVAWTDQNLGMEILSRSGAVIDVAALAASDDPFGPELRKRTAGLEKEEELLGFLKGVEGQWGSTRKKRKIVEASDFGEHLPKGWKILLSLKRKEGRVWLSCRRYISPSGQQFVYMREVASYLQSTFGAQDKKQSNPSSSTETGGVNNIACVSTAGLQQRNEKTREGFSYIQASPQAPLSTEPKKLFTPLRVENLAVVEVDDHLICHKCNTRYADKDMYLQHLLTSHQSRNKSRLCTSISDGVIIKDGKYECQFCHKVFLEKHRYNGHVGNHVKDYVKRLEASSGKVTEPKRIELSPFSFTHSLICKKDELVETNKGSTSTLRISANTKDELNVEIPHSVPATDSVVGALKADLHRDEMNVETPHSLPGTDCDTGTSNANPNSDEMNVDRHSTPIAVSVPGTFISETVSAEINVEDRHHALVVESVLGTSNAKSENDAINVDAPQSTPIIHSASGISIAKSDNNAMNVEAPLSKTVADIFPGMVNAKSNPNEIIYEVASGSPVEVSVRGVPNANSKQEEMNVEAPFHGTPFSGYVPETLNSMPNCGVMSVEPPHCTPITDSVLDTFNVKSSFEEVNIEARDSTLITDSVSESVKAKCNHDQVNVEAPYSILRTDSVPKKLNAKSYHDDMNVEVPPSTAVTDSVQGTSNAKYEMNREASPHGTPTICSIPGSLNTKSNYSEMNLEAPPHSVPVTESFPRNLNAKCYFEEVNVEAPHNIPATDSIPETPTPKSNWGMHLSSSYDKEDRGVDQILACGSYDKQHNNYAITSNKISEIHESNNNLFGTFNSFLYSQSISSGERNCTSKTNGDYVFGSTSGQNDKYELQQETGSESCWLSLSIGQQINEVATSVREAFSLSPKESELSEAKECYTNETGTCFGIRDFRSDKYVLTETIGSTDEGNLLETMMADTSLELAKSSNCFPTFNMVSDKGENDIQTVNQRQVEKVSEFEELKLDDMENSRYNSFMRQESNSLQDLEVGLENSVQFDWDSILPNTETRQQLTTTICVFCGLEFNLDAIDAAMELNSVGFLCPSCKARISGHL